MKIIATMALVATATMALSSCGTISSRLPPYERAYDYATAKAPPGAGFGKYTYIAFPALNLRACQFLEALHATAGYIPKSASINERRYVNLYVVPLVDGEWMQTAAQSMESAPVKLLYQHYDKFGASRIIRKNCNEDRCDGQGPYLLYYATPDFNSNAMDIIDLSKYPSNSFEKLLTSTGANINGVRMAIDSVTQHAEIAASIFSSAKGNVSCGSNSNTSTDTAK